MQRAPGWLLLVALALLAGCERRLSDEVIIAGTATPDTPGARMWLGFKERVEEATGGRIRMRALIYGQLGSEEQLLSGLRRGRIHYANLSAQVVSTVVPELTLLYAPYLFDSEAEADFIYDRYLTPLYRELLGAKDLHLVTWYEIGFHHVYAVRPIIDPADAHGRRFRIASSLSARLFAQAIGADPILLGFGDIVPSLQTGLIEAGENSILMYARTGIAGEAPHLTLTGHVLGMSVIVSRKSWWDRLAPGDQRLLTESFPDITESRRQIRAQTAGDLRDAAALGYVVHPLSAGQRGRWRQACAAVTAALLREIGGRGQEIFAAIERGKAEYARSTRASAGNAGGSLDPSR
jgi:TRAP-type C4-dicarboxylate transport system substrate-binding protein